MSLLLRQWIRYDQQLGRHTDAEDTIESHAVQSEHLDHGKVRDLSIQLAGYPSRISLYALPADYVAGKIIKLRRAINH